jgi:FixJ family two-component response regulator
LKSVSQTHRVVAIVDDEETVRVALERLLRNRGIDAEVFASGEKFLQSLDFCWPDCVILDLQIPEASGFDVVSRMAAAGVQIPIVALTGRDALQPRRACRDRECD